MTQVVATGLEEPVIVIIFYTNIFSCWEGKGSKKETEKVWSFAKPPPVWSFFTNEKLNHNFFLEFLVNHQCGDSPHFLRDFFIETFPNHI